MTNYLKSGFSKILILVILFLLLLGFFLLLSIKIPKGETPSALNGEESKLPVIASFEEAPTNFPADFPKEVIRENETLEDFGIGTQGADGKEKNSVSSVSYVSDKNMQILFDIYVKDLPDTGWNIVGKSFDENVSVIRATKGAEVLLLAIALLEDGKLKVTFQYER